MKKGDYEYMMYSLFSQLINLLITNTPPQKNQKQLIDDTQNIIAN